MSDVLGDVVDENLTSRQLAPSAVLTQVVLMSVVSVRVLSWPNRTALLIYLQVISVLAFNVLRPRNKVCPQHPSSISYLLYIITVAVYCAIAAV